MWMMSGVRSGYDQNLRHLKMKNLSLSLPSSLFVCWFDFPNSLKGKLVRMCVLSCSFVRVLLFTVNLVSSFLKWFRESIWMKESFSLSLSSPVSGTAGILVMDTRKKLFDEEEDERNPGSDACFLLSLPFDSCCSAAALDLLFFINLFSCLWKKMLSIWFA